MAHHRIERPKRADYQTEHPLISIGEALYSLSFTRVAADRRLCWLWGIVHGFDAEQMADMARRNWWSDKSVARLQRLHAEYLMLGRHWDEQNPEKAARHPPWRIPGKMVTGAGRAP